MNHKSIYLYKHGLSTPGNLGPEAGNMGKITPNLHDQSDVRS